MATTFYAQKNYSQGLKITLGSIAHGILMSSFPSYRYSVYPSGSKKMLGISPFNSAYPFDFSTSSALQKSWIIRGFGLMNTADAYGGAYERYTYYAESGLKFLNKPIIPYLSISKVKDVITKDNYFNFITTSDLAGGDVYSYYSSTLDAGTFISTYGDYYIISNVQFYDNTNDGGFSTSNKRPLVGNDSNFDYFQRVYFSSFDGTSGDGDLILPIFNLFFKGNVSADNGNSPLPNLVYTTNNISGCKIFAKSNVSTNNNKWAYQASGVLTVKRMWDLATLKYWLNELGIPFSFSLSEIETKNTDEFSEWQMKGQGTDTIGGGTGTGDNFSDDITVLPPNESVISTLNKHYACTRTDLSELTTYLWNSTFLDDIKLLFNNPMECIVSCRMFPFTINGEAEQALVLGNVTTTVNAAPINSNYNCVFSLGEIEVKEYFGSALDYEPYTTLSIYLPYIGIKDLSTNEFMGKMLKVKYVVDITTGACIAQIWADAQLLYSFDGKIGVEIPINSSNAAQFASSLALTGISAASGLAVSAISGNPLAAVGTVLSTAKGVASNQFHVNKGGVNSPFAALYMPQYCYLIMKRPIQSLASSFGATMGFPCNITDTISNLKGFVQCENVMISDFTCTDDEKTQIKQLLESGVYVL